MSCTPGWMTADDIDILDGQRSTESLRDLYGYAKGWGELGPRLQEELLDVMAALGEDQGQGRDQAQSMH